jgi:hypothetical protein
MTENRTQLRSAVKGAYDLQALRIMSGNRLVANFKSGLGINPSTKEEDNKEATTVLNQLKAEYKLLTDGVVDRLPNVSELKRGKLISSKAEAVLVQSYLRLLREEKSQLNQLKVFLSEYPIWTTYLQPDIRGIGPAMAGVLISELDPHKAKWPSSFHRYAGIGGSQSRKTEDLIDVTYTDKDGNEKTKKSISYNPFLKAKLMGVMASLFLKGNAQYKEHYDRYKHRIQTSPNWEGKSKGHIHMASQRYMMKIFLTDLWKVWRELEGLEVGLSYAEQYHGENHPSWSGNR